MKRMIKSVNGVVVVAFWTVAIVLAVPHVISMIRMVS